MVAKVTIVIDIGWRSRPIKPGKKKQTVIYNLNANSVIDIGTKLVS